MSAPKTKDEMTPITLYGRVYNVVGDSVKIPTRNGEVVVTLEKVEKRKDWYYSTVYDTNHFTMVDFDHMVEALYSIIAESEILPVG